MRSIWIVFRLMRAEPLAAFEDRESVEKQVSIWERSCAHGGRFSVKECMLLWDVQNNPELFPIPTDQA